MELHEAFARAMMSRDEAEARVYGWLPGVVTDIDTKLMQIKARIGKQGDNESTDWLIPAFSGSVEELPEVGDPVSVDFMDGDIHRGRWSWFPQSTTNNRATEALALGTTLVGVVNQIQSELKALQTAYAAHKHTGVTTGTGSSAVADTMPSPMTADQCLASDGSVVPKKSGQNKVLSKRAKVR